MKKINKVKCECCKKYAIEGLKTCGEYNCVLAYRKKIGLVFAKEKSHKEINAWKKKKEMKKKGLEYEEAVEEHVWEIRK